MMAPVCGWDTEEDTWEARDRHESSISHDSVVLLSIFGAVVNNVPQSSEQ